MRAGEENFREKGQEPPTGLVFLAWQSSSRTVLKPARVSCDYSTLPGKVSGLGDRGDVGGKEVHTLGIFLVLFVSITSLCYLLFIVCLLP